MSTSLEYRALMLPVVILSLMSFACAPQPQVSDGTRAGQLTCKGAEAMEAGNFMDAGAYADSAFVFKQKYVPMLMNARQKPEYDRYAADVRAAMASCSTFSAEEMESWGMIMAGLIPK